MRLTNAAPMRQLCVVLAAVLITACDRAPDAAHLNAVGLGFLSREQFDSAIATLNTAIAAKPDFAEAYRNRGRAFRGKGDLPRAHQDLDRAIALSPGNAAYYNDRGLTYQFEGEYERAVQAYTDALRYDTTFVLARKNRGRVEFYLGRFGEAADDLERGRKVDSTNTYLPIWLHFINRRLGKDDTKEFAAQLALTDMVHWPAPLAKYFLGQLPAETLIALSANTDSKAMTNQTCAVDFYMGEELVWQHRVAEALPRFERTRATCPARSSEYEGAVAELQRLKPSSG